MMTEINKDYKTYKCKRCDIVFVDSVSSKRKYCSKSCSAKSNNNSPFLSGKNHCNYKHGTSRTKAYKKKYDDVYHIKHKDRTSTTNKEWYQKNKILIKEKRRQYYIDNIDIVKHRTKMAKARRRNAEGSFTLKQWRELKAKYNYTCLCCKKQEPEIKLTIDHIKPISLNGTNYINNIQPLCLTCNISKSAKEIDYRGNHENF